jgi:hypothetical protein
MTDEMLERRDLPLLIQALLARRAPRLIEDREALYRRGAVLIPLLNEGEEYKILFTKRTDTVKFTRGRCPFPGAGSMREIVPSWTRRCGKAKRR